MKQPPLTSTANRSIILDKIHINDYIIYEKKELRCLLRVRLLDLNEKRKQRVLVVIITLNRLSF